MIDTHDYHVTVTGTDATSGLLDGAEDGLPGLTVASPPEFGGPPGTWSPEHLFLAAVAGCLMTTFRSIAARSGLEVLEYFDHSIGRLERSEDGLYSMTRVTLRPTVVVAEDSSPDRVIRLLDKAEKVCLIGRSVRSEIVLQPNVLQAHHVGT